MNERVSLAKFDPGCVKRKEELSSLPVKICSIFSLAPALPAAVRDLMTRLFCRLPEAACEKQVGNSAKPRGSNCS